MTIVLTQSRHRSLRKAILAGDVAQVRAMLAAGMPPDALYDGLPPLFLAAGCAQPDLIGLLIGAGANPNRQAGGQSAGAGLRTALNAAAGSEVPCYACVERLLDHGADPCLHDDQGRNAAHVLLANATFHQRSGDMPHVNHLLERMLDLGVSVNSLDGEGRPLLHYAAVAYGELAAVALLLGRGADPLVEDARGWSALDYACLHGRAGAAKLLVGAGADVNRVRPGSPLLHLVQDIATLDVLLAAGIHPDPRDDNGQTALAEALGGWRWANWPDPPEPPVKALRLIAAGASLDAPDAQGVTPRDIIARDGIPGVLQAEQAALPPQAQTLPRSKKPTAGERRALARAIVDGDTGKLASMLAAGAQPDVAHGGVTPLFLAAAYGRPEMIDLLVAAGANPNRVLAGRASDHGPVRTALNAAAGRARVAVVERLLAHGANPLLTDDEGRNAAHLLVWAADNAGRVNLIPRLCDVLQRMLELGVPAGATDHAGANLLHYAVRHRIPVETLRLLIERGADPLLLDSNGTTPLQAACFHGTPAAITLLLGLGADVDQRTPDGRSLLELAGTQEHLEALLAAGPDLESRDAAGRTALFNALHAWKYSNYPGQPLHPWKAIRLIAAGASLDTPAADGLTPRDVIVRDGIEEVMAGR
jgi:ankyrin repeat protein